MRSFTEYLERKRRQFGSQFDPRDLDCRFVPYFESGKRISVKFPWGEVIRGTVGVTTGWKPVFLLMRTTRSIGSDLSLGRSEMIVPHVPKRRPKKPRTLFNMRRSKKNPTCVVCHGDLVFIGGLGNLKWFSCRSCGIDQSRKVRARRPKVKKNHAYSGVKYWEVWLWNDLFGRNEFIAKVRATYPQIRRYFPGAAMSRLDDLVGQVMVTKKSQIRIPAKVRK